MFLFGLLSPNIPLSLYWDSLFVREETYSEIVLSRERLRKKIYHWLSSTLSRVVKVWRVECL